MNKIDILNREDFVKKLVDITENISANKASTSFAINGSWGCGKSFILEMFEEQLSVIQSEESKTDKYFIVHYNCWKYDYYDEPLVAIVAAMIDIINERTKIWNDEQKKAKVLGILKSVGTALLSMANNHIKDKTGVDLKTAFEVVRKGAKEGKEKYKKSKEYDNYFSFKQALCKLQDLIAELSEEQTIVFIVDELDRCLPEYAIKVLERLHHLTEDVKNVTTIISIDKKQLTSSINQIFGQIDAEQYLKKFIKFEVELNKGFISERFIEKHSDYISLFNSNLIEYEDSIEEFMQSVFNGIDVREQEQLIHKAKIAHTILFNESKDLSFLCMEILIIIIFSQYDNKKWFCPWLEKFQSNFERHKSSPPFSNFFDDKFKKLKLHEIHNAGGLMTKTFVIQPTKSIYAPIAYTWVMLNLQPQFNNAYIGINENNVFLDKNTDELKKYIEFIKFIK